MFLIQGLNNAPIVISFLRLQISEAFQKSAAIMDTMREKLSSAGQKAQDSKFYANESCVYKSQQLTIIITILQLLVTQRRQVLKLARKQKNMLNNLLRARKSRLEMYPLEHKNKEKECWAKSRIRFQTQRRRHKRREEE